MKKLMKKLLSTLKRVKLIYSLSLQLARYEQDLKVSMQVNEELLSRVEGINEKETKYQLSIENL